MVELTLEDGNKIYLAAEHVIAVRDHRDHRMSIVSMSAPLEKGMLKSREVYVQEKPADVAMFVQQDKIDTLSTPIYEAMCRVKREYQ